MVKSICLTLFASRHRKHSIPLLVHQIQQFYRLTPLLLTAIIISGCANTLPKVPALGPSGNTLPGKVVWHDLVTPDIKTAKNFYGNLFGWIFEDISNEYSLVIHNGRQIAGIAKLDRSDRSSNWLPLISVAQMDNVIAEAMAEGGKTILKPFYLADRGRIAVLKDPQGAAFGLVQTSQGDPVDRDPEIHGWLWNEIWTEDVAAAIPFYQMIGDYRLAEKRFGEIHYQYLEKNGHPRIGLIEKPSPEMGNTWAAYIRVADVQSTVDKAKTLGGNVLMAPTKSIRSGTVAVLTDPNGAGFVVQEWTK